MSETKAEEVISARIPSDLAESLRDLALRHERTPSQEIRIALRRHIRLHALKKDRSAAA
jgi:predicted transcriptional regulator